MIYIKSFSVYLRMLSIVQITYRQKVKHSLCMSWRPMRGWRCICIHS